MHGLDSHGVQAFVLILAGYETTANALAFAIYLLSTNPAKRERLLEEVDAFGRNRAPTLRDLDRRAPAFGHARGWLFSDRIGFHLWSCFLEDRYTKYA